MALGPRKRRGNPTAFGGTRTQDEEGSVQEGVKAYIERIFSSGGTRIRTGDTMIFSPARPVQAGPSGSANPYSYAIFDRAIPTRTRSDAPALVYNWCTGHRCPRFA